jgi:hypothetical protein
MTQYNGDTVKPITCAFSEKKFKINQNVADANAFFSSPFQQPHQHTANQKKLCRLA